MGCQSLKDGLEGNKKSKTAEEFLIEKKNPLVLPPDFEELPEPSQSSANDEKSESFEETLGALTIETTGTSEFLI